MDRSKFTYDTGAVQIAVQGFTTPCAAALLAALKESLLQLQNVRRARYREDDESGPECRDYGSRYGAETKPTPLHPCKT